MSKKNVQLFLLIALVLSSCKPTKEESKPVKNATPVTVSSIRTGRMDDVTILNATSVFRVKTYIKSPVNGYIREVNAQLGARIGKGNRLFVIRSKEAENLANTVNRLDTVFHFKGITSIKAPCNGYITELNYRQGDYVQDGEILAAVSDATSLVFMLDLPYDLKPYLHNNKTVYLTLPDHTVIKGKLDTPMPVVDPVSQTQRYVIRIAGNTTIPENLVARVSFVKNTKRNVISLPKEAVLTNEIQSEYWIMKMSGNSVAVKVPIEKGIESNGRIEIVSPHLSSSDKIIVTGNYGLPDRAQVYIENN